MQIFILIKMQLQAALHWDVTGNDPSWGWGRGCRTEEKGRQMAEQRSHCPWEGVILATAVPWALLLLWGSASSRPCEPSGSSVLCHGFLVHLKEYIPAHRRILPWLLCNEFCFVVLFCFLALCLSMSKEAQTGFKMEGRAWHLQVIC